jgi:hypothetical protein
MKSDPGQYIFWVVFGGIVLSLVWRVVKHGGFRAAMFGSRIQRTVGELDVAGRSIMSMKLRVHVLGDPPDKAVGLEFVSKSVASYHMTPITLSASQARELVALLQTAAGVR